MISYLKRLHDERLRLTERMSQIGETAASDDRDTTEAEKRELAGIETRIAEIDPELERWNSDAESTRAFATLTSRLEQHREQGMEARRPTAGRQVVETTSFGQTFTESDQFRSYSGRGQSGVYEFTDFLPHQQRAPIMTTDLAIPSYVLPPRVADITIPPMLTVVDVVGVSAGTVEWVEVSGDPQAQVVPEGTAKPEAVLTFTPRNAPLDTLAHWSQITRQALEDATYIRSVIEGKLRRGITLAIADAIQDALVAATLPAVTAASLLEAIRVGIGTVQQNGYQPNAVMLNPADYAALDNAVMGGTLGGPTMNQTFWGLTPIASRWQTAGVALVGDFKAGVVWFDRNVSSVFISDSHADLFIKNTLVILAETRGKAAVPEPLALCECQAGAGAADGDGFVREVVEQVTDIASPPATGVWYDIDVTASNVLHQLRLQGGDVDATRIRTLIPEAGLAIDQYVDGETVIDGPPPAADFQGTLERYTIELYRSNPSGEFMTTSPGALHLLDILDAGIGYRKRRWAVS